MSSNKYYIFIKSTELIYTSEILAKLKLQQYKPIKKVPLHYSNKPETLFTASFKDTFLLVHPELVFEFFGEQESETEKLFFETFPDSEITAVVENSTVGLFTNLL